MSSHLDLTEIAPRLEKLKMFLEKKFMITKSSVEEEELEEDGKKLQNRLRRTV